MMMMMMMRMVVVVVVCFDRSVLHSVQLQSGS
jgi:hypothetical protein